MQKRFLRTLKAAVAFSLVFSMSMPAFAASEKEEAQQTLENLQNEKAALQSRLAQLQANKADTESYIQQLDAELTTVTTEIARLQGELDKTQAELEQTQADLEKAKEKEAEQYEALKARIKAMYEKGDASLMEIFMQAEDISTLLNAPEYISSISEYDNQLLTELDNTRKEIERLEAQLEAQKAELEDLKSQEEAKQEELQMVMDAKYQELAALGVSMDEVTSSIYNTEAEIAATNQILEDIRKAEEEAARKAAEEAARKAAEEEAAKNQQNNNTGSGNISGSDTTTGNDTNTGNSGSGNTDTGSSNTPDASAPETGGSGSSGSSSSGSGTATGSLMWPCAGGYISSHYGGRVSPTAGASSNHKGIDIAAGAGTAIYAADGGVVTTSSYSTARGYYIVVSHGNGMSTLYQHCSAVYASVGQTVSQGQVIAAVGSTGYSTGPHLHFEVLINGVNVDPENYI